MAIEGHNFGTILDLLSGLLLVALGVFVARVRPHRATNYWFAAFSALFGAGIVVSLVWLPSSAGPPRDAALLTGAGLLSVAAATAVVMAVLFANGLDALSRSAVVAGTLVGSAVIGSAHIIFASGLADLAGQGFLTAPPSQGEAWLAWSIITLHGVMWGLLAFLAVAYRNLRTPDDPRPSHIALMAAAITIYPGYCAGAGITHGTSVVSGLPTAVAYGALAVGAATAVSVLWLWSTRIPSLARRARNLALLTLALPLVGVLVSLTQAHGGFGWARTTGVVILAYAVVRHSLFDIELTANWTLRRGTLAGFVIAVFFIVSETAQEIFATQFESALAGILAAGVLMFFIAPLQRISERLADAAIPGGRAGPALGAKERREVFRHAVTMALADGVISPSEDRALARIATVFEFTPEEALRLRQAVEGAHGVQTPPRGGSTHPPTHEPAPTA